MDRTNCLRPYIFNRINHLHLHGSLYPHTDLVPVSTSVLCGRLIPRGDAWRHFFLATGTSAGPRAPASQSGSRQSGNWAPSSWTGSSESPAGLDRPKCPRAGRTTETPGAKGKAD